MDTPGVRFEVKHLTNKHAKGSGERRSAYNYYVLLRSIRSYSIRAFTCQFDFSVKLVQ